MLSHFPARDVEEPVTKDHLRAEMAGLRTELHAQMADLRTEMHAEMGDLRTAMADLRTDMERMVRSFQAWTIGAVASVGGLVVLAEKLFE